MSDYISRKALIDNMDKRYNEKIGVVPDNLAEGFHQMENLIKEQSTVFDLGSVIEQLEEKVRYAEQNATEYDENGNIEMMDIRDAEAKSYRNALEIIKSTANVTNGKNRG